MGPPWVQIEVALRLLLDRLVEYAREQAAFSAWSEAYGFET